MTGLPEFLLARIAEDEAAALAATPGPWRLRVGSDDDFSDPTVVAGPPPQRQPWMDEDEAVPDHDATYVCQTSYDTLSTTTANSSNDADHITRWDPARVLAECAAKRRIVQLHHSAGSFPTGEDDDGPRQHYCATCGSGEPYEYPMDWPCDMLKLLALPYSGHSDYRREWAP